MSTFEPKIAHTCSNNIWARDQFWEMANRIAIDIIANMAQTGHPLPQATKNGIIDQRYVSRAILDSVCANINAEFVPAGNA
jgi:hypothetical protein